MVKHYSKLFLFSFLLMVIIFVVSCSVKPTCNSPYILVGNDCCLDKDGNSICDKDENSNGGNLLKREITTQIQEKEKCPFACCINEKFERKLCDEGYDCINNECVELDSDNDGLSNLLEKSIGTNIKLDDTDGDGLKDSVEFNIKKTDPTNPNTDNDRYNDFEDKDPLVPNSAVIELTAEKVENPGLDLKLISSSAIALGTTSFGNLAGIAAGLNIIGELWNKIKKSDVRTIKFTITNSGDDYTEYVIFDLYVNYGYTKKGNLIGQKNIFLKRYNLQEKVDAHTFLEKADVFSIQELTNYANEQFPKPTECQGLLSFCDEFAKYNIQNVDYKKYAKI